MTTIPGTTGADVMFGNQGASITLAGGQGNDVYILDEPGDEILELANEGTDTMIVGAWASTMFDNVENAVLVGNGGDITGNALNNTITGGTGDDSIDGGDGDDSIIAGIGNNSVVGGIGNDVITALDPNNGGGEGDNTIEGGDGNDSITTGAGIDEIYGDDGNDTITAGAGADTIEGGLGNDVIDGGTDVDTMIGGAGDDTYSVDDALDVVTELAAEGTDTIRSEIDIDLADYAEIENVTLTGTSAVSIVGSAGVNVLTGNSEDNVIDGDDGNDTISGGTGNDTLTGGLGDDTMIGGADNDTYYVDSTDDVVTEAAAEGVDFIISDVDYTLSANVENLELAGTAIIGTGNTLDNIITGNAEDNTLNGGDGVDTLFGADGADTLIGGAGDDTLEGGDGDDVYIVDSTDDVITEVALEGTDEVRSSVTYFLGAEVENITLTGTAAINATGNTGDNVMVGNSGNNMLEGGLGDDTMSGGLGNDTYVVTDAGDIINENASEGTDTVIAAIDYTMAANVENMELDGALVGTGNALDNTITATNNGADHTIDGALGADRMVGRDGDDTYYVDNAGDVVVEADGEGAADTVVSSIAYTLGTAVENLELTGVANINATGNGLDNIIIGNDGNNTIDGRAGVDNMVGGLGDDVYIVDDAGDTVTENAAEGTDTVRASVSHTLSADVEHLSLTGNAAINATGNAEDNSLVGNNGANTLDGDLGADTMIGGLGNDTYVLDDAGDVVTEAANGGARDTVQSAAFSLDLADYANVEHATLTGALDLDLTGNNGANTLTGNDGENTIDGGLGADRMIGGDGDDTYILNAASDIVVEDAAEGEDTVRIGATYTLGANLENLILEGTAGFNATGNAEDNTITGNDGNNRIDGKAGADDMTGGLGDDTYTVDNVGDVVNELGGQGTDTVNSSVTFTGGDNVEKINLTGAADIDATGGLGAQTLTGNRGDNILDGDAGADRMLGLGGNDTIIVDNVGDVAIGGAGVDTIESSIDYTLANGNEHLTLTGTAEDGTGNAGINIITGNAENNTLSGLGGNDTIDGGVGEDLIIGGIGNDRLTGGANDDIFEFSVRGGVDTITDFDDASDALDLSALLSAYDPLADDLADFLRITDDGTDSTLQIDANGAAGGTRWVTIATLENWTTVQTVTDLETAGALITS